MNDYSDKLILDHLRNFYDKKYPKAIDQIIKPIIYKESKISLRLLEYFVTKYSKEIPVIIKYKKNGRMKYISVYDSYTNQLHSYDKKRLDPFNRNHTKGKSKDKTHLINFDYNDNKILEKTTICQLNFFRWIINENILSYVNENLDKIRKHMDNKKKIK